MSQLQYCLAILGFNDIQDVTAEALKKAFKITVLRAHPDKGGHQDAFDELLSAYLYLLETVNRLYGGRRTLQDVVSPEELKEERLDEIVHRVIEEFEREAFNAAFDAQNPRKDHGYADWLKDASADTNVMEGAFGGATQIAPSVEEGRLQEEFERTAREGKPVPGTSLMLHPDEMAYVSGQMLGTVILDEGIGCYTSDLYQTPEYTDVYAAFTKDNTLCDKMTAYTEGAGKTLEQLMAEREAELAPLADAELAAITEFEAKKQQQEKEHLQKIKDYYENHVTGGALNWSVMDTVTKNFIIEL